LASHFSSALFLYFEDGAVTGKGVRDWVRKFLVVVPVMTHVIKHMTHVIKHMTHVIFIYVFPNNS
jgi:hypothetical protein